MSKIFTLEWDEERGFLEMHLNKLGAEFLRGVLSQIIESNKNCDYDFMTPDWGGNDLTSEKQGIDDQTRLIHHLKLMYWE